MASPALKVPLALPVPPRRQRPWRTVLVSHVAVLGTFVAANVVWWHHTAFAVLLYGPPAIARLVAWGLRRPSTFTWTCILNALLVAVWTLRPLYVWSQVQGYGNAPCGRSSCSRNTSLALLGSTPPTVYHPHGWFPRGTHAAYDPNGNDRYMFCDLGCRWADDTHEPIRTYEQLAGGSSMVNYDRPVTGEAGFITRRLEDYPNPAVGVVGGWSPGRRANNAPGTGPCPGNYRQETCGFNHVDPGTCNHTVPAQRYWRGRRICATCSEYDHTVMSLFGGTDALPDFVDPEQPCAPRDTAYFWCAVCPRTHESKDPTDLLWLWIGSVVVGVECVVAAVLVRRDDGDGDGDGDGDDDDDQDAVVVPTVPASTVPLGATVGAPYRPSSTFRLPWRRRHVPPAFTTLAARRLRQRNNARSVTYV